MKKIKSLVAVSLALCMVLCFAGCSSNHDEGNLKDNLVNGFNNWLESFSKHAVTKDKNLQGDAEKPIAPANSRSSCICAGSSNTARSARSRSSIEFSQQRLCQT